MFYQLSNSTPNLLIFNEPKIPLSPLNGWNVGKSFYPSFCLIIKQLVLIIKELHRKKGISTYAKMKKFIGCYRVLYGGNVLPKTLYGKTKIPICGKTFAGFTDGIPPHDSYQMKIK